MSDATREQFLESSRNAWLLRHGPIDDYPPQLGVVILPPHGVAEAACEPPPEPSSSRSEPTSFNPEPTATACPPPALSEAGTSDLPGDPHGESQPQDPDPR